MGDGTHFKSVQYHDGFVTRDTTTRGLQANAGQKHLGRYDVVHETRATWQASLRESGIEATFSQIVVHYDFRYLAWIFFFISSALLAQKVGKCASSYCTVKHSFSPLYKRVIM